MGPTLAPTCDGHRVQPRQRGTVADIYQHQQANATEKIVLGHKRVPVMQQPLALDRVCTCSRTGLSPVLAVSGGARIQS